MCVKYKKQPLEIIFEENAEENLLLLGDFFAYFLKKYSLIRKVRFKHLPHSKASL